MILANNTDDLALTLSPEINTTSTYTIKASAKAFAILSSGLYSDKILAICRELGCNAVDSHKAAGVTRPFDVHLPNALEPHFSVRDYGVGLSREDVMTIYTTYFESTKTRSNDFTGALGLGSKSPFSYTPNFTVTAIKDGIKGIYTAFITEQGIPSVALMMEHETEEPNGVEVMFSVTNKSDFQKFCEAAATAYAYFDVPPNVTGSSEYAPWDPVSRDVTQLTPSVSLVSEHRTDTLYGSVAVMGNVAYPIDIPSVTTEFTEVQQQMLESNLEIHFAIGELDFQASREGLSYIPMTVQAIKRKLEEAEASTIQAIKQRIENTTGEWERHRVIAEFHRNKAFRLATSTYLIDNPDCVEIQINGESYGEELSYAPPKLPVDKQYPALNIELKVYTKARRHAAPKYLHPRAFDGGARSIYLIPIATRTHFVENPLKVGGTQRMAEMFKSATMDDIIVMLTPINYKQPMDTAAFYALIHNPPNLAGCVTSVAAPPKVKSLTPYQGAPQTVWINLGEARRENYSLHWRPVAKHSAHQQILTDTTTPRVYMLLSRSQIVSSNVRPGGTLSFLNRVAIAGILPHEATVLGVRAQHVKRLDKFPNWISIEQYVERYITNISDNDLAEIVWEHVTQTRLEKLGFLASIFKPSDLSNMPPDFSTFVEKLSDGLVRAKAVISQHSVTTLLPYSHSRTPTRLSAIMELHNIVKANTKTIDARITEIAKREFDAFEAKYPLLGFTYSGNNIRSSALSAAVRQYVELVNSSKFSASDSTTAQYAELAEDHYLSVMSDVEPNTVMVEASNPQT